MRRVTSVYLRLGARVDVSFLSSQQRVRILVVIYMLIMRLKLSVFDKDNNGVIFYSLSILSKKL